MSNVHILNSSLPPRFARPKFFGVSFCFLALYFFATSVKGVEMSLHDIAEGIPAMGRMLGEMFPPALGRLDAVGTALLVTFQMALVGTFLGVVISFPLSILASSTQAPNRVVYFCARGVVSLCRTVPDLIWAIFFVITVGLGPFAGTLALMMDTIGFCGRFFAEAIEEVEVGPIEALTSIGARKIQVIFCAVLPAALPSFTNSILFSLEKAVRSSVVLGLVGAGGIGVELKVSMDMFQYAEAATIIGCIFILVLIVEQVSASVRRKIM